MIPFHPGTLYRDYLLTISRAIVVSSVAYLVYALRDLVTGRLGLDPVAAPVAWPFFDTPLLMLLNLPWVRAATSGISA